MVEVNGQPLLFDPAETLPTSTTWGLYRDSGGKFSEAFTISVIADYLTCYGRFPPVVRVRASDVERILGCFEGRGWSVKVERFGGALGGEVWVPIREVQE